MRRFLFDWPIFGLGLILSICGLVFVYSATWEAGAAPGFHASDTFIKQFFALIAALGAFQLVRRIKWGLKPDSWLWFYVPILALLVLVLFVGSGHETHGAKRWIDLGFFNLQPAEPAKLAWILLLAWLFSVEPGYLRRNYFIALFLLLTLAGLIFMQPDLGTSMAFVFIFFLIALFAQVPRRLIGGTILCFILAAIPGFFFLKDYQQNRILALVGLQKVRVVAHAADPRIEIALDRAKRHRSSAELGDVLLIKAGAHDVDWQARQSMIGLGSGGLTGKGFLRGTQAKGGFVPFIESDFIFALIGEEFGFVGCGIILLLFFLLIARILALSHDVHSAYERYICYGASALLLFHVFIAAGMTMRLTPITGLPLPFISQGGSSLITFWLLLAVLESIYTRSQGEYITRRRYTAAPRMSR